MKTARRTTRIGSRAAMAGAILGATAAIAACTADMGKPSQGRTETVGTERSSIATAGWVATWGTSPQASGQAFSANTTLRQIVHASIAGSSLRLQLSNAFGNQAITIKNVHVAKPTDNGGWTVDLSTDKKVTFGGQTSVTIAAGQVVASDPVNYAVTALQDVAVTFYLPNATGPSTYNWLSSQNNYSVSGDATGSASMPSGTSSQWQYYFLMGMDVQNSAATGAIVTLGASITNGYQSPGNTNQRWPDDLAVRINNAGMTVGVLNAGISGNELLVDNSWGPSLSAEHRFTNDVTNQSGVRWVVFSDDPINDIGNGNSNGSSLVTGYQQIITDAHSAGFKIICSTLTPFQGSGGWSTAGETARGQVNSFVRGSGSGCDAILDQDTATHDPNNPTWFLSTYDSGDHLHPNAAGYQAIANAFNLSIFNSTTESPYGGTAWAVPGVVEAENYDLGGEGLAYHDNEPANLGGQYRLSEGVDIENCGDTGGGYDVGWTNSGEWMKYTVNVASSGTYNFTVRAACPSGGCSMQMEVDGTNVTGTMSLATTGAWQTYADNTKSGVSLTAGQHVIRIYELSGGFNLNRFTVSQVGGNPSSCKALHSSNPSAGSGQYTIDPGTGAVSVYCDMAFNDGTGAGGWTLVEAIQANNSPSNTVAGVVTPGTTTAMPVATVKALAGLSSQVHIRTPGMASTQSITSVANSSPIVHLRAGNILNDLGDSQQYQNWTGPYATAAYLNFSCATTGYTWPSVYWACGNGSGTTIVTSWSEWKWSDNAKEALEVYVR